MIAEGAWKKNRTPYQKDDPELPRSWGATCTLPQPERKRRLLPLCVAGILCAFGLVLLLPRAPATQYPSPEVSQASAPARKAVRSNSAVLYGFPEGEYAEAVYSSEQLLRGKLPLVDGEHPIPDNAPAPNTLQIAAHGKGVIPVRDLSLKSAAETIDALYALFYAARQKGIEGLAVYRATLSASEQRDWQLDRARVYSSSLSLTDAAALARSEVDDPGQSEHQLGYTVDIRLFGSWGGAADDRPLGLTEQGRYLLQNAWRYGFVMCYPDAESEDKAHQFRYVGVAHSTAMTYLDLRLADYLALLHERGVVQIHEKGAPRYLIVCKELHNDRVGFSLPVGADYEASYDNCGYAVVACTYR